MKRSKPLASSGFKSKLPPRRPAKQIEGYTPRPREVAVAGPARAVVPLELTAARLRELYRYDADTGTFFRLSSSGGRAAGSIAGAVNADGYVQISIGGRLHYAHRLAWLYMTGEWPAELVDHEDRVRNNNAWHNLRLASNAENCQNLGRSRPNSSSGFLGVSWSEAVGKWRAYITVNGVQRNAGYFDDIEDAKRARVEAEAIYHPFRSYPKAPPVQNEAYMAAVRKLPCYRCGAIGRTQFCHADEGKGAMLKTDCRLGWPGCGPDLAAGDPGCHYLVGSTGKLGREGRRTFEAEAGAATRAEIRRLGQWPDTLPAWPKDGDPA